MPRTAMPTGRCQKGALLIEALVAFLILSIGMLTVARMQTHLRADADLARQRSEAVRLAQQEMETLRAFTTLDNSGTATSYASIASHSRTIEPKDGRGSSTSFGMTVRVDPEAIAHAKTVSVAVRWTDRKGVAQQASLSSIIAASDPAYGGAFAMERSGAQAAGALGRATSIPLAAKDLGDGRSAFKPFGQSVGFIFDNRTGLIVARCTGLAAHARDMTSSELAHCAAVKGLLLSGVIRFAAASPDGGRAASATPSAAMALSLTGGFYAVQPDCSTEPPESAAEAQASSGAAHSVAYRCVVYPLPSGTWSGRASLVPIGWNIGASASDRRVCRYVADLDKNGSIDANIEHPANYTAAGTSLTHQNFLVISATNPCPIANTAQHQP